MKEVKYYVSDDEKMKSTNENDIIDYENIQNIFEKTFIKGMKDDECGQIFLHKLEDKNDLWYLSEHFKAKYLNNFESDSYIGYVIVRCCANTTKWEIVPVEQHLKELKDIIEHLNAHITVIGWSMEGEIPTRVLRREQK